jgi:Protein of unknown function (DUF2599)
MKYKKTVAAFMAFTFTAFAVGFAQPSSAEEGWVPTVKAALQYVNQLPGSQATRVLDGLAKVQLLSEGKNVVSYQIGSREVDVPRTVSDALTVSLGSNKTLKLDLPSVAKSGLARLVADGIVAFDNGNSSVTAPIVKADGSLQLTTILLDRNAPNVFAYPFTLPSGCKLQLEKEGGVSILDQSGNWVAGIAPAWARDATGRNLNTDYQVQGNTLFQRVDTQSGAVAYPVVADPWLGVDLIDHTTWNDALWSYSPTLMVFPTIFGRYLSSALALNAAWSETLDKTARRGHPNPDTPAMRVQFDCHYMAVRVTSPNKSSWNLDSKLPWTDFLTEVNYGCNYPVSTPTFAF